MLTVNIEICLVKYMYTISKYTKIPNILIYFLSISNNCYIDYAYKNTLY